MTRNLNPTDRERQQVLRSMLEARRTEIQDKLRSLRETLPAELLVVKDAEEQSMHDFVQDVELALVEMKSETLARIDEALRRLEEGSYGVCTDCGAEIAEARLRAVPFATRCLACQEVEEDQKREKAPERAVPELNLAR
ncbi:MAG TPA: TraR/DksA family transcriptional regulator [Vicinamibacteria bacterium]|jgi:DnaK suppressor protein